jgi:hypothetical protein
MAEFSLQAQEPLPMPSSESQCERGQHTPHPLWAWRCGMCLALLCRTCGEELEQCPEGGSHER